MSAPFQRLDHIAIIVRDTDEALTFYRDRLGLPLLFSQVMPDAPVRLTHLDAGGGVHLQLVQPLSAEHPLSAWLDKNGEGLQHLCFKVDNVAESMVALPGLGLPVRNKQPHCGPNGRSAAMLELSATRGVQFEIASDPRPAAN
jgi:catechol 2,3-dioxygenase-like lactoylglutathione lyase family enzyme